ncbi:tetratricopeptide repeat protein [Pontibacterium granulatum]|uniref:tetratricopeptide repeat protein n=1 Tax=Pontibacterium granulatum TaxID=2036029 RepID=UPI00249C724A|nr:tetratricopeptide repeat protein [Pontibacterium granulatum]MDI3323143.1 tetratricopeptide repeat protein [Pontibacterium granulatum]
MASLQRLDQAPGKKRWLPIAIVAAIATGVIAYSVLDSSDKQSAPISQSTDNASGTDQNMQQAYRLAQDGLYRDALNTVNQALASDANNMDAQLLQATLLAKTGNTAEAERRFNTLHEQYPDRPEPLNNLAVLYAEAGDSSRAIQTLQKAFKTHPSYDQVYQNLGDMYAALAAEAYNKALGLPGTESGPQLAALDRFGKQTAINASTSLISLATPAHSETGETTPAVVATTPTPVAVENVVKNETVEPEIETAARATADIEASSEAGVSASNDASGSAPETVGSSETVSETSPLYTNVVLNEADSEAITAVQSSPEISAEDNDRVNSTVLSASPEELAITRETERAAQLLASLESDEALAEIQEETIAETPSTPEELVSEHLKGWAEAWSAQDVDGYLRAYVAGYKPNDATSHKQWAEQRRSRLTRPSFIKVELSEIDITMLSDNRAEATFRQSYQSDRYRDVARKRINLMRRSSGWKIVQEKTL